VRNASGQDRRPEVIEESNHDADEARNALWRWLNRLVGRHGEAHELGNTASRWADLKPHMAAEDILGFVLQRPDKIRERAQYTATVQGVLAAAITAGAFAALDRGRKGAAIALGVAVVFWLFGLAAWVHAIGGGLPAVERHLRTNPSPSVDLARAIARAHRNAETARGRILRGQIVTLMAIVVTVGALIYAERVDSKVHADIQLTPAGAEVVRELCNWAYLSELIHGKVALTDLGQSAVIVTVGYDPPRNGGRELSLQRGYVIAAAKTSPDVTRARHAGCAPGEPNG